MGQLSDNNTAMCYSIAVFITLKNVVMRESLNHFKLLCFTLRSLSALY